MEYAWENRRAYIEERTALSVRRIEETGGIRLTETERAFLIEEIRHVVTDVVIDTREAELKASGKW